MSERSTALVRPREPADAAALVAALALVQAADAYPMMAEHVDRDWLYGVGSAAWTALLDGVPVGHVCVVEGFGSPASEAALGTPAAKTLGVSRFFVAPQARGSGAGSGLLDAVDAYATGAGRPLGLEVAEHNTGAMRVYEHRGWRVAGEGRANWFGPDGPHPRVRYYVKP